MRLPAASLPNTIQYVVGLSDTITRIALLFNTTPTELSRLNHLSSSLLYPGQSLKVPARPANIADIVAQPANEAHSTSEDVVVEKEMDSLQNKQTDHFHDIQEMAHSDDEVLQKYLKVKSKYVTDGHGVVSGVLLVTPQTVMFNPCVSDHLVMERGVDMYVVKLPLTAISSIVLFEDIAAMVVGDYSKQYIPKVDYLNDETENFFPKPGMVICQNTGEKYVFPTLSFGSREIHVEEKDDTPIEMMSHQSTQSYNKGDDQSIADLGIGSSHEFLSDSTMGDLTTQSSDLSISPGNECENLKDFVHKSQLSSTPKHQTTKISYEMKDQNLDLISVRKVLDSQTKIERAFISGQNILPPEIGDTQTENKSNIADTNDDSQVCGNVLNLIDDHFDLDSDSIDHGEAVNLFGISETIKQTKESTIAKNVVNDSPPCNMSKDSGTSDGSFTNSPNHELLIKETPTTLHATNSSLSNEARQWLGKRGVKLSFDDKSWALNVNSKDLPLRDDITPRLASKVDDHLMYVAIKVHKTYWCPIRAKHNQIMGIPPNRDQKRREHWFAIPKDTIDQFYNFLLYWSPDLYGGDSSGFSTPCSSECDNLDDKLLLNDNKGCEMFRSRSLHSVSSKSSSCSFGGEEMPELQTDSQLLSKWQIQKLTHKLPSRTVGHSWELVYSTTIHGISLSTLYRNCQGYDTPILIVIKDGNQKVFGAFLSEAPKVSEGFFGTGESMLFSFLSENKLKTYMWTGDNNFFIKGSKTSLIVGGGEGVFGLWLDEDLYRGHSHSCKTFGNDSLSSCEDFICSGLEAWGFV